MKIFVVRLTYAHEVIREIEVEDDKIAEYMYEHYDDIDHKQECFQIYGLNILSGYFHESMTVRKISFEGFKKLIQSLIDRMPIPLNLMTEVYHRCSIISNYITAEDVGKRSIILWPKDNPGYPCNGHIVIKENKEGSVIYNKTHKVLHKFDAKDILKILDEYKQIILGHKDKLEQNRKKKILERVANPKDMIGAVEALIFERYNINIKYANDLGVKYISLNQYQFGLAYFPIMYISVVGVTLKVRFNGIRGRKDYQIGNMDEPDNKAVESLFRIIDKGIEFGKLVPG